MSSNFRRKGPWVILLVLLVASLVTLVTMLLWNALIPPIFHFSAISFWQALGLLILFKLLFGGFHGPHRGPHPGKRMFMREFRRHMSPEERERFNRRWADRCWWRNDEGGWKAERLRHFAAFSKKMWERMSPEEKEAFRKEWGTPPWPAAGSEPQADAPGESGTSSSV